MPTKAELRTLETKIADIKRGQASRRASSASLKRALPATRKGIPQSDTWLNSIFADATGGRITDAADRIHTDRDAFDRDLAGLGIRARSKSAGTFGLKANVRADDRTAGASQPADKADDTSAMLQDLLDMIDGGISLSDLRAEIAGAIEPEAAGQVKSKMFGSMLLKPSPFEPAPRPMTNREKRDAGFVDSLVGLIKPPVKY